MFGKTSQLSYSYNEIYLERKTSVRTVNKYTVSNQVHPELKATPTCSRRYTGSITIIPDA
jgi:hypothetical protein